MEKLVWSRSSTKAKVMGTIISITGAFVVTLYKVPAIFKASKPSMPLHQPLNLSATNLVSGADSGWVIGGAFFTAQFTLIPLWFIVLTQIMEEYPAELTVIFLYNFCVHFNGFVENIIENAGEEESEEEVYNCKVVSADEVVNDKGAAVTTVNKGDGKGERD
ncbi:Nodulin MtN21 /EamA-like transporter family protein isoform 2 [Hibiscus syriacus]|uniref:Nodulin MtN21 /EamA-like transporter family protein isoform 2 n=1 Tax=Hibiscus syriacus TaxID=106335 RepID=A0A6A3AUZ2_HIBSY|nr:Nodulin MtN21 /EamA-like transporter family protein isoform 2 [Hibiscus syriacus]